ncbi:MAG: hypothetical protein H8E55_62730 [Pelagibacterales bacterium]|nr:hypothetical protein [Pelagibacterales bacterium]
MKILKLLNNKSFSIFCCFFIFFSQNLSAEDDLVDIWDLEEMSKKEILSDNNKIQEENINKNKIFEIQSYKTNLESIVEDQNLSSKKNNIVGIYDPEDNDLSIEMWVNSDGANILKIIKKVQKINLSDDATAILNLALLTNSYFPQKNINNEQFLKIKSDWLLKQQNLNLIETYLEKNKNLDNRSNLIKYYVDYYLSRSDLGKACEIFDTINNLTNDNYISKFNIYCLLNLNKNEEAQLHFDLLKEIGFEDKFFEKKFTYLIGYDTNINVEISEKSLLDFHLSHRTNPDFTFEPKINTSQLIWKYLSSSNLLESIDIIDLEDTDKIFTIEKATHDKNYKESELFALYERFRFNINQLLTVRETYKLLPNSASRALLYQGILLTKEPSEKIQLIKLLKELFEKDNISNAFDVKLVKFLKEVNATEVPSNYTDFYQFYLNNNNNNKKIKFNDTIIHQSKLLDYFKEDSSKQNIEKDLESLLKKIKKNSKYFFSIKDMILLESLKADGVQIPKKYKNIYEPIDANIPHDIQILINQEETGLFLLRLVEIIGEDKITDMDPETLYFIISSLNQLDIDQLRNQILLKVLPLKV